MHPICPRVKLQNRFPVLLTVIAEVEDQRLEVFDIKVIHHVLVIVHDPQAF